MKIAKIIAIVCTLVMIGGLLNGFINGNFFEDGAQLMDNPWGVMSLIDLYVGFTLFAMWIAFRESSILSAVIWIVLLMIFGFLISSIYIWIQLNKSEGDWLEFFLGARKNSIAGS
jgi:hypothetical protein